MEALALSEICSYFFGKSVGSLKIVKRAIFFAEFATLEENLQEFFAASFHRTGLEKIVNGTTARQSQLNLCTISVTVHTRLCNISAVSCSIFVEGKGENI